jgi:hypothetical protein
MINLEKYRQQDRLHEQTDMAVVVSPSQNEVEDLRVKGADIVPHRRRMNNEDLDEKFKDPMTHYELSLYVQCG